MSLGVGNVEMSRTDLCTITKTCLPVNIYKLKCNITQVYLDQGVVKQMKTKWIKYITMDPSQGQNTENKELEQMALRMAT